MVPVFQGGDLCDIMEKGPHKTICISGFVRILKYVGCNQFKLCDPRKKYRKQMSVIVFRNALKKNPYFVSWRDYNQCPCLPKAELNIKTNPNGPRLRFGVQFDSLEKAM